MPTIHLDGRKVSSRVIVCNECRSEISLTSSLVMLLHQEQRIDLRAMLTALETVAQQMGWTIDPGTGRGHCPHHAEQR